MAQGNHPQWNPRQTTYKTQVGVGAVTIFPAGNPVDISHMTVGVTGAATVTLRGVGTGTAIAVYTFVDAQRIILPGWKISAEGLEVHTSANTLHVTAWHGTGTTDIQSNL